MRRLGVVLCLVWLGGCDGDEVRGLRARKTVLEHEVVSKFREANGLQASKRRREEAAAALVAVGIPTAELAPLPPPAPRPALELPPPGLFTSAEGKAVRQEATALDRELRDLDRVVQEVHRLDHEANQLEARLKEKKPD